MRCPNCRDEYEDGVLECAECAVPLVADGDEGDAAPVATRRADARLGRFHPAVAERLTEILYRRGIEHDTVTEPDGVRVLVEAAWRDDLRAELATTWNEVVRHLSDDDAQEVMATGGPAPGWYDAPRGGHVDREGRLVVHVDEDAADDDAARVLGPALLTAGAILAVVGWHVLDAAVVTVAGVGLAVFGLLLPR